VRWTGSKRKKTNEKATGTKRDRGTVTWLVRKKRGGGGPGKKKLEKTGSQVSDKRTGNQDRDQGKKRFLRENMKKEMVVKEGGLASTGKNGWTSWTEE